MTKLDEFRAEQRELTRLTHLANDAERRVRREAEESRKASMPQAPFEPPAVAGDEAYVTVPAGTRLWAYDPRDDRVYLAAVAGQRLRPGYAKALGIS